MTALEWCTLCNRHVEFSCCEPESVLLCKNFITPFITEDIKVESQCEYCGYSDKQRCRNIPEASACNRANPHNAPLPVAKPIKRLERHTETTWDWCQYATDEELGLWTVRKTVKTDHAKFHSQNDAIAFIKEMEKNGKS